MIMIQEKNITNVIGLFRSDLVSYLWKMIHPNSIATILMPIPPYTCSCVIATIKGIFLFPVLDFNLCTFTKIKFTWGFSSNLKRFGALQFVIQVEEWEWFGQLNKKFPCKLHINDIIQRRKDIYWQIVVCIISYFMWKLESSHPNHN